MPAKYSDAEFANLWRAAANGSPAEMARITGQNIARIYNRRANLAKKGIHLQTIPKNSALKLTGANGRDNAQSWQVAHAYSPRINHTIKNACVLVGSDAHYWPGIVTLAHKAFVILAKQLKPAAIVMNGDVFDGANISRHDPMGWQKLPTVLEELDAVKVALDEIERAAGKAHLFWTVGNHDSRFDRRLAMHAAEFDGVPGFRLEDHFKSWDMAYSLMLNESLDEPCMIRHAMRGGIHAIYNNTLHAGVSIVTGHLHAQLVRPFTDYRGTRYGVDCGTMADIDGPQFSYTMDGPVNWRSGFVVLTFDEAGRLMPPELVEVQHVKGGQRAVFRGEVIAESASPKVRLAKSAPGSGKHIPANNLPRRKRASNSVSRKKPRARVRTARQVAA